MSVKCSNYTRSVNLIHQFPLVSCWTLFHSQTYFANVIIDKYVFNVSLIKTINFNTKNKHSKVHFHARADVIIVMLQGSLSIDQLLRQFICPEIVESVTCPECAKKCKKSPDTPSSVFRKKLTLGKVS